MVDLNNLLQDAYEGNYPYENYTDEELDNGQPHPTQIQESLDAAKAGSIISISRRHSRPLSSWMQPLSQRRNLPGTKRKTTSIKHSTTNRNQDYSKNRKQDALPCSGLPKKRKQISDNIDLDLEPNAGSTPKDDAHGDTCVKQASTIAATAVPPEMMIGMVEGPPHQGKLGVDQSKSVLTDPEDNNLITESMTAIESEPETQTESILVSEISNLGQMDIIIGRIYDLTAQGLKNRDEIEKLQEELAGMKRIVGELLVTIKG